MNATEIEMTAKAAYATLSKSDRTLLLAEYADVLASFDARTSFPRYVCLTYDCNGEFGVDDQSARYPENAVALIRKFQQAPYYGDDDTIGGSWAPTGAEILDTFGAELVAELADLEWSDGSELEGDDDGE